jgi:hypothetical protein
MAQRRLANQAYEEARERAIAAKKRLREEEQNRRLIAAAEGRYARALNRTSNIRENIQSRGNDAANRLASVSTEIGNASRGNYLTNLYQGRQREFARGGAGMGLSPELQQQARNVRGAWDLATAGGRENLQLMQRIATEMAGLLRQQNELNRGRTGRSTGFETGRRGQERITALSAMPGADPARIRRLRSQATDVISASNTGDIAGSREATRRMNASIGRYTRELNAAATELRLEAKGLKSLGAATRTAQSASTSAAVTQAGINAKPFDDRLKASAEATRREAKQFDTQGKEAGKTFEQRLQNRVDAGKNLGAATQAAQVAATKTAAVQAALDDKTFKNKLDKINQLAKAELKRIKDSDKADLKAFDDRLKNRTAKKKQDKENAFFQGDARRAIGDALIGGAFPALFGQGFGASVGGAAGGAAGGLVGGSFGFGLSLIGTAVGQAVDTTVNNLTELATALKTPDDTLQALAKSGFYVSNSLEFQVKQLESVGRAYDAQTLVLQEVEKRLGTGSVRQLNALESEQRRLQEQWSSIAGTLQSELLPALVGFTGVIADTINVARGIGSLPGAKQVGLALRGKGVGGAVLTAVNPLSGFTTLFDKLQQRGKTVAAGPAGNRQAAKAQDEFAAGTAQIQESRKIADQIQSAYREAFSLQREAYDLQRNGAILNRDIADYSYKKEREIFDLRQQAAEKQIENNRGRAQNRIEGSDLNARQVFSAAVGFEQQLLTNVREVVRSRKEGEADIEQSRNRLELAMAKLNRDVEDYKRTNAREIEDIEQRKLSYVRSVEDYKWKVADHVRDRAREAADLWKQAMTLPDMGAAAAPGGAASGTANAPGGVNRLLQAANNNLGLFAGQTERCADAIRELFKVAGVAIGSTKKAWDGLGSGPRLASSFFGSDMGQRINNKQDLRPGDLVGFERTYGNWGPGVQTHVGLYAGGGEMYDHSSRRGLVKRPMDTFAGKFMYGVRPGAIAPGNIQGQAATQISNIPGPKFSPVPIGPTPSIAPVNAANLAANLQLKGGTKEAQQILEEQNKLKQKGIELGQIEQILQASQLPQLKQQGDTLKQQIEARQKILDLSNDAASVADIEAESKSRLKQIELDRVNALASAKKKYGDDPAIAGQINFQAGKAVEIAKSEENQRRVNLDLNNKRQNQEQSRSAILQLQETLATGKAEAAALERGELKATNVELLKASELYKRASDDEKITLALLTAQTEELGKQNDFRRQINGVRNDARYTGAGLRAGLIGAPARAYEQGLKDFNGDTKKAMDLANENKLLENQQLIWGNLEKNIVATSDAISGALTNGLVSIVDGSRKIEDVGRDMLKAISGSFADSAQQQLSVLMQRQIGGLLGGPNGPLVKMLGPVVDVASGGGETALSASSMAAAGSLNGLTGAAIALQTTFQAMAAQGVLSGPMLSGATGGLGAALSGSLGNIGAGFSVPPAFGGFMAKGGTTKPGEGYIVGEKEPEFFFPGVTGRVVPRSDMQKAEALRNSGNESDSLDISYTVKEERGERYVTEDQLRKSNAMVERRAFAKTINGMKNNGALRDSINI